MEEYLVPGTPGTLYYVPNFITEEEEQMLLKQVYESPKPKWTYLSNRRLQNWGGLPHPKGMVAEDLPQWLQTYSKKLSDRGLFDDKVPNHVLVNEYESGQGIMPHEDGPLYLPTVCTISLGSHTFLDFYQPIQDIDNTSCEETDTASQATSSTLLEDRHTCSMLLERRSLICVKDDMYKVYLHGIDQRHEDTVTDNVVNRTQCACDVNIGDKLTRTTRVSLTIRYVPKILKTKLLFGAKRRY